MPQTYPASSLPSQAAKKGGPDSGKSGNISRGLAGRGTQLHFSRTLNWVEAYGIAGFSGGVTPTCPVAGDLRFLGWGWTGRRDVAIPHPAGSGGPIPLSCRTPCVSPQGITPPLCFFARQWTEAGGVTDN